MKKIYYEKKGRRYVPVAEYDSDYLDSFPKGDHLVMVYPGGTSRRFNIDPAYAPMIAAGRVAEDEMCKALVKASELRPSKQLITEEQKAAWENLARAFGQDMYTLNGVSISDVVQAGIEAMQKEANKLMKYESVQLAYNHFIMVCKLCKESEKENV